MKKVIKIYRSALMVILAVASIQPVWSATLESARLYYDCRDYRAAVKEYGTLLTLNWPKDQVGGLYDAYTDCLVITGNYDLADAKIDAFVKMRPDDPVVEKMAVRKIQIAYDRADYAKVVDLANQYLAKYPSSGANYHQAQQLLASCQARNSDTTGTLDSEKARSTADAAMLPAGKTDDSLVQPDALTQITTLMTMGNFNAASEKIDACLAEKPADSVCQTLMAQKARLAYYKNEFTSATQIANEYLAKYDNTTTEGLQTQQLLVESLAKCGNFQERVDYVEKTLVDHPKHPFYAGLRRAQADTILLDLNQPGAARAKYADAIAHADPSSEIYETSAQRVSDILFAQAKAVEKADPKKSNDLTTESQFFAAMFVDHPGADKNYPANAVRRLTALKRLKRFEEMESEAARYLGDANVINAHQVVAVKSVLGEYPDFMNTYGMPSPVDQPALKAIKAAYYSEDYAQARKLADDYLTQHTSDDVSRRQVQRLMVGTMAKSNAREDLVAFVDRALAENPNHPMYADFRRAQGDALYGMKDSAGSRSKYIDSMAHSNNDSDVYDWCCYRAGATAIFESNQSGVDSVRKQELRAIGHKYLSEYVALPSKNRIYPANVVRRMQAYNWLNQRDQMELEAAQYLFDRADYNQAVYVHIQRMLSYNRSARQNADSSGALAAFEQLRLREYEIRDVHSKASIGVSMIKAATYFRSQGSSRENVEKLHEVGCKFLRDALRDENLKLSRRMDAYYFLQDWAAIKEEANKRLALTRLDDSETRAELLNWLGISLAYQKPQDTDGAVSAFDRVLAEYDRSPQLVNERAVLAAHWAMWLRLSQKENEKAQVYVDKLKSMPDSELKTKMLDNYAQLTAAN